MKRPTRVQSQLSQSLHHQLNAYALAATAAGVGILVSAQPAEAKIIYTPAHVVIGAGQKFQIDLNHDGIVDFGLQVRTCSCTTYRKELRIYGNTQGATYNVVGITSSTADGAGIAAALKKGSKIPKRRVRVDAVLAGKSSDQYIGNWFPNVKNRYLGLTFYIHGKKHYGWARVSVQTTQLPFTVTGTLTGYAFETIVGKSIRAGQTKEADDPVNQDPGPGASLTNPIPDFPQPTSLGAMALGARALSIRRRDESGVATQ